MEYLITDQETNESFMCNSEESLLAGMRRSGKGPVQCGCFNGGCGNCRVKILEGQYEKFHRMSKAHVSAEEETQGYVLACCVKPLSNITLKAEKKK